MTELRLALRSLRRAPGLSAAVILTLGLGIGSVATMFSITRGILRDLPVERSGRLVHVAEIDRRSTDDSDRLRAWELVNTAAQQTTLTALAAYEDDVFHVGDDTNAAQRVNGAQVTANTFGTLRVQPVIGRSFAEGDALPGAIPTVILGYTLWRDRYALDHGMVGRTVRVNGTPRVVIGVMPEGFRFPREQDLWIPFAPDPSAAPGEGAAWTVFGRLRDDRTIDDARTELAAIGMRFAQAEPATHEHLVLTARPYRHELVNSRARGIFRAMLLLVSFVLVIACANVTNLLLARALARRREVAVRTALGASRGRIVAQLLAEVMVLALAGGVLGVMLASLGVTAFNRLLSQQLAFFMVVKVDGGVLLFAAVLVALATLFAGLAPARQASRVALGDVLREHGRGASFRMGRASRVLVAGEVALSGTLLVITGLMVSGAAGAVNRFSGLAPEGVLSGQAELRAAAYPDTASRGRFVRALHRDLSAIPGARAVAIGSSLPGITLDGVRVRIDGSTRAGPGPRTGVVAVAPAYLAAFNTGLVQGREFEWSDDHTAPRVALVSRRFAERHLTSGPVLGQRIRLEADSAGEWATVIGIVPDIGGDDVRDGAVDDQVYFPVLQSGALRLTFAIRGNADPLQGLPLVREAVKAIDPDVPLFDLGRFDRFISDATIGEKFFGGLFSVFGISALVMACVGLFGMVAFGVRQRMREMGIRVALGARPVSVMRLVMRGGLIPLCLGLLIGLGLAVLLAPQLGDALLGANARDWRVYAIVISALAVAGFLAAWIPSRRVLHVEPSEVLREE
jgi:putative ABC transport system permease protein